MHEVERAAQGAGLGVGGEYLGASRQRADQLAEQS